MHTNLTTKLTIGALLLVGYSTLHADTFGTGLNQFTIDFVNIGNAGNADDAGAGGGLYSSPFGGVLYVYRMGTFEISQDAITNATASGLLNVSAGPWTGSQPAASLTWYEAAAFVNFLNTSTGHQAAYQLTGVTALTLWSSAQAWQTGGENLYRHKDAYYFLPSEDEWYKAAFHKNDGVTANYWDYATASNSLPTAVASGTTVGTAVYNSVSTSPAAVNNAGGLSAYGTMGQNGNVYEWNESAFDGINNSSSENRADRGGDYRDDANFVRPGIRFQNSPTLGQNVVGIRVASVPEPSVAILLLGSGLLFAGSRGQRRRF